VFSEELDALRAKRICFGCVGEQYLSSEIRAQGKRAKCSYCGKMRRAYSVGNLAERFEAAFEQHYVRSSDQPNDFEFMLLRDRESSYEWDRAGEPVTDAIVNAADIPQEAAEEIQKVLEDKHEDRQLAEMGEETEFAGDSYYQEKGASDRVWQEEWRSFENSLKTEARFFSRTAADHLKSIFDGIGELQTRDGRPLVVDAGPGTDFHTLYRARVFQSDDKLEAALGRPDKVGTGWSRTMSSQIRKRLDTVVSPKSKLTKPIRKPKATWVEPSFMAEVEFRDITSEGLLRQSSFKGLTKGTRRA
jgi:hypothetical protein